MSRVMHCISSLAVGGVETCVLDMFKHFAGHTPRHEHILCAFKGGKLAETHLPAIRAAGFETHVLHRPSRYSFAFCRELRATVDRVKPDVIQAYNPTAALWVRVLVGKRKGVSIIVHCGGVGGLRWKWRTIERTILPRTNAFVFNSQSTRAIWESFLRPRVPTRVVYNGVTFEDTSDVRAVEVLPASPFALLTVCRVVPVKALHTQLEALRILHDRGQDDVRLIVVGDGPTRRDLEGRARSLGFADAVTFAGYQPDPRVYHRQAHVYLCTSYNETFSMTLAEAMYNGMVCIAASAGGPSEIIEDGQSGFLLPCTEPLPPEFCGKLPVGQSLPALAYDNRSGRLGPPLGVDPGALADTIADVRERFDELGGMRDAAHARIVEHFSVERYCRSLEDLYDEMAGQP